MKHFLMAVALSCMVVIPAHAGIQVTGSGESMRFDPGGLSSDLRPGYELMVKKCTPCHSQQRIVTVLTTGVSPLTNQMFDLNLLRVTVFSMVKRANLNPATAISKDDAKTILTFLQALLRKAAR